MSSEPVGEAFVWIWLPGASEPVVAGRLDEEGGETSFVYGRSYLARPDAISLYSPELPLTEERIRPLPGLDAPGCILDARPDAWGQRVILTRIVGSRAAHADRADLGLITLLLESSSDRAGALDFQHSADAYVGRGGATASLDELATAAQRVEEGLSLSPSLEAALLHGSSIGGARPKALIEDGSRELLVKFSSTTDTFPVEKGEYVAMELARRAGLHVARVELTTALKKTALLVERFDRVPRTDQRLGFVSALTMLGLNEAAARHASYAELAQIIRARFANPGSNARELFSRITFNILVGNTDDHARNHAAFWDGRTLTLTPAFDICPQLRNTGRATQAMIIGSAADHFKESQVAGCVERAHLYQLNKSEAAGIVAHQIDVIRRNWSEVCDLGELSQTDRRYFWKRQFLNDYALEGWREGVVPD